MTGSATSVKAKAATVVWGRNSPPPLCIVSRLPHSCACAATGLHGGRRRLQTAPACCKDAEAIIPGTRRALSKNLARNSQRCPANMSRLARGRKTYGSSILITRISKRQKVNDKQTQPGKKQEQPVRQDERHRRRLAQVQLGPQVRGPQPYRVDVMVGPPRARGAGHSRRREGQARLGHAGGLGEIRGGSVMSGAGQAFRLASRRPEAVRA